MKDGSRGWRKGAFLLTVAGPIRTELSAGDRIPLQNLTGDIGFFIYQQVYPLLGIGAVLSLYGFPSAVSYLTADAKRKGYPLSWRKFYFPVLLIIFFVIGVVAIILFALSEHLAIWIGDVHLTGAYKLTAISLITIPFTSLLRGVSQGDLNMKPTAYSQLGEQLVRVTLIILMAVLVANLDFDHYTIGQGAAVASFSGALVTIIILLILLRREKQPSLTVTQEQSIPWGEYFRTILIFGFVASLNHMVLLLFQFADSFTLFPALQEFGLQEKSAMEAKGVFDRGQPLIQLGTVLGSSFALAMIPTISRERFEQDPQEFYQRINSSIAIGFYLAVGATAGLITIMPEANLLLFQDMKGTGDLRILVLSVLLTSVGITSATILQGLGWVKRTAIFILLAVFVKWLGNILLVPVMGITGSALATVIGLGVFMSLVMMELRRKLPGLAMAKQINWWTLTFAVFAMVLYIFIIDFFVPDTLSRSGALVYVLVVSLTGAIIYIIVLLRGRAFISREISILPFANLLMRIYKERKVDDKD